MLTAQYCISFLITIRCLKSKWSTNLLLIPRFTFLTFRAQLRSMLLLLPDPSWLLHLRVFASKQVIKRSFFPSSAASHHTSKTDDGSALLLIDDRTPLLKRLVLQCLHSHSRGFSPMILPGRTVDSANQAPTPWNLQTALRGAKMTIPLVLETRFQETGARTLQMQLQVNGRKGSYTMILLRPQQQTLLGES